MSFTFVEIKKNKTTKIAALFVFLIFFYFLSALIIEIALKFVWIINYSFERPFEKINIPLLPGLAEIFIILGVSFITAFAHWYFSTRDLVGKTLAILNAKFPEEKDSFHTKFKNIIDEVSVATGSKFNIEKFVIPSSGKNAFSISDFSGRCAIGVTEGLLAKLSRAQLESVIAHEAAHIVSGDSLLATVSSSIFGLYAELIRLVEKSAKGRNTKINLYLVVSYLLLSIFQGMNFLIMVFVSREKEYRADAVAVELARDPLSLAEALYIISNSWRGSGLGGDYLESVFIMNPSFNELDEKEGVFAELFSTHPPASKRIKMLLEMAHINSEAMISSIKAKTESSRVYFEDAAHFIKKDSWVVATSGGKWAGPFDIDELKALSWLMPQTWVEKIGEHRIKQAYEDATLGTLFTASIPKPVELACPSCKCQLGEIIYEEVPIYQCRFCRGVLIEKDKMTRILTRNLEGFKEEVVKMSDVVKKLRDSKDISRINIKIKPGFPCPRCSKAMNRKLYSLVYPVEIDTCAYCNLFWFERYELEVLQKLYEENEKI